MLLRGLLSRLLTVAPSFVQGCGGRDQSVAFYMQSLNSSPLSSLHTIAGFVFFNCHLSCDDGEREWYPNREGRKKGVTRRK